MQIQNRFIFSGVVLLACGSIAALQLARSTSAGVSKDVHENFAAKSIRAAGSQVRNSNPEDWDSVLFIDATLSLIDGAYQLVVELEADGGGEASADRDRSLDMAAHLLDLALVRMDAESGEEIADPEDDWILEPSVTAELYGLVLQARTDVLRLKQ